MFLCVKKVETLMKVEVWKKNIKHLLSFIKFKWLTSTSILGMQHKATLILKRHKHPFCWLSNQEKLSTMYYKQYCPIWNRIIKPHVEVPFNSSKVIWTTPPIPTQGRFSQDQSAYMWDKVGIAMGFWTSNLHLERNL